MHKLSIFISLLALALASACTSTYQVGMLSLGDLEGKTIQADMTGEVRSGESCWWSHHLSDAVRDAVEGTNYDTLLDVTIEARSRFFVWSNCVHVEGQAIDSSKLEQGVKQ